MIGHPEGTRLGIVGGGLLGMTLALQLSKRGFRVSIIESAPELGGLASSCKIGEYTWDRFYHVILMSDANLLSLLDELKLKDQINWGQTKTGFYTDGRLYSMSNAVEFLTFPPLNLLDKFRLGATIFYASKVRSWERLEGVSVEDWLTHLSGKKTFNKIWLPLLKSKLGTNYKIASASFIWAIISRLYAARRSGLKKEMFGYVSGGYAKILAHFRGLLSDIGVQILTERKITQVVDHKDRVEVLTSSNETLEFDRLILTVPTGNIPDLCGQLSTEEKERFLNVQYQRVVCAAFMLKKPLAGYYVTNITDDWVPFTGVIEMTSLVDRKYFNGNSLIYLPRYLTQKDPFWEKSDAEIKEIFLGALQSMYPKFGREDVIAHNISRADNVLPITTLDYSKKLLPPLGTSLKNVFVVDSAQIAHGTMNANEIVGLANKKAGEIADILYGK
jgi:protoporphyrinogen oxidase